MTEPVVLHERPEACREVPDVGDVREYVVCDDQIGSPMILGDVASCRRAQELHDRRNAQRLGCLGHVLRRLDAQDGNVPGHEVLEQVPVVARHLGDEASLP